MKSFEELQEKFIPKSEYTITIQTNGSKEQNEYFFQEAAKLGVVWCCGGGSCTKDHKFSKLHSDKTFFTINARRELSTWKARPSGLRITPLDSVFPISIDNYEIF